MMPESITVEADDSMLTPYGPPGPSAEKIQIPNECVGILIGKGGESIRNLQAKTGTKVQIAKAPCKSDLRKRNVFIEGAPERISEVKILIEEACKPKKQLIDERWEPPVLTKKFSPVRRDAPVPKKVSPVR